MVRVLQRVTALGGIPALCFLTCSLSIGYSKTFTAALGNAHSQVTKGITFLNLGKWERGGHLSALIHPSGTCYAPTSISHFLLCPSYLLMPLWGLDCNDNHCPFWNLIGEDFLGKHPTPTPSAFIEVWDEDAFLFLGNPHCKLAHVCSSNHESHFVSGKMMTVSELFPKSLWAIIHHVGPWF